MTIPITGGAGCIGSNFVLGWRAQSDKHIINLEPRIDAGNLQNLAPLNTDRRHRFVRGDIDDGPRVDTVLALHTPGAVIHFAAESHGDSSGHGPGECIQANVIGTFQLLESVRANWGQRDNCAGSSA